MFYIQYYYCIEFGAPPFTESPINTAYKFFPTRWSAPFNVGVTWEKTSSLFVDYYKKIYNKYIYKQRMQFRYEAPNPPPHFLFYFIKYRILVASPRLLVQCRLRFLVFSQKTAFMCCKAVSATEQKHNTQPPTPLFIFFYYFYSQTIYFSCA